MMADRLEILVHTTAPSLGRDDALYRSLATAYLDFKPHQRTKLDDDDFTTGVDGMITADMDAEQQLLADVRNSQTQEVTREDQSHMFFNDSDSWILSDSQISSAPKKEYFTRSKIATTPASAIEFLEISFASADGISSPRFLTRDRRYPSRAPQQGLDEEIELEQQDSRQIIDSQIEQPNFKSPNSEISDSRSLLDNCVPASSTPSIILDTFLSNSEGPHCSLPSPVREPLSSPRGQIRQSRTRSGQRQFDLPGRTLSYPTHKPKEHQVIFQEPEELGSPPSPTPTRRDEAPSTTIICTPHAAESPSLPIFQSPSLGPYRVQVQTTSPPTSPPRSSYKRIRSSLSRPTPGSGTGRLSSNVSRIPDTPYGAAPDHAEPQANQALFATTKPTMPPIASIPTPSQTSRKRYASRLPSSSSIYPLAPRPSTDVCTTFLTTPLANLAAEIGLTRYRPVSQSREIRKHERGYWRINVPDGEGGWGERATEKAWEFLREYIGRGKAGWGVWCVKEQARVDDAVENGRQIRKVESEGVEWRIYCWGEVVPEIYLLLYLASSRNIRTASACWIDGGGDCVVKMPSDTRRRQGRATEPVAGE